MTLAGFPTHRAGFQSKRETMTQISQMSLCVYVKCLPVLVVWTTEIFALLACWEEQREIGLIWKREGSAWMLGKTF